MRDSIAPQLEDAGVDVLDLTFGAGPIAKDVKAYLGTEPLYSPPGERAGLYRWVRERLSVPLLGRSRITDPAVALHMVEEGAVDLLGIGRQLLADPDFPLKTAQHRWDAINRCIGCDVCLAQTVLRGRTLSCPINPTLGREVEQRPSAPRARVPRRVHVVGAGIAGLETAWGLARRGHQVTLWEQAPAPGGLLRQVAGLPAVHLRDLASYGAYVLRALAGLGVELRLGTRVTAESLSTEEGETVVLAIGARPHTLASTDPSQGPAVVGWTAYLAGQATLGERVGVVSHGEGAEFALSLARTGHGVWLLEQGVALHPAAYDYAGRRCRLSLTSWPRRVSASWGSWTPYTRLRGASWSAIGTATGRGYLSTRSWLQGVRPARVRCRPSCRPVGTSTERVTVSHLWGLRRLSSRPGWLSPSSPNKDQRAHLRRKIGYA